MSAFPTAASVVYRNEDGEVTGWDTDYGFEPDVDDFYNAVDDGPDFGDLTPEECQEQDRHGGDAHQIDGDLWECDWCCEKFSYLALNGQAHDAND